MTRSARTWVGGGVGHLSLHDARVHSIEQIEELEKLLAGADENLTSATLAVSVALHTKTMLQARVDEIQLKLKDERYLLIYRAGSTDG
jgi:hypothetical protein